MAVSSSCIKADQQQYRWGVSEVFDLVLGQPHWYSSGVSIWETNEANDRERNVPLGVLLLE